MNNFEFICDSATSSFVLGSLVSSFGATFYGCFQSQSRLFVGVSPISSTHTADI